MSREVFNRKFKGKHGQVSASKVLLKGGAAHGPLPVGYHSCHEEFLDNMQGQSNSP